jgi:uncharacterized membrane protein YkvA (DUF1232 family)
MRAKALVVGAVCYLLLPIDLIPDILPFFGVADDITILLLGGRWFLSLCPPEAVQEQVQAVSEEARR